MLLGVVLILASAAAYNASTVLLAAVVRGDTAGSSPIAAVGRRIPGLVALALNAAGWGLEIAALTLIPLTLARILSVAGLGVLLGLARRSLGEVLERRDLLAVGVIALGTVGVVASPPRLGTAIPAARDWLLLVVLLGPVVSLPQLLRALHLPVTPTNAAVASGTAYALSGIFTKGVADLVSSGAVVALGLLTVGMLLTGVLGFVIELDALRRGHASVVVPIILAIHTIVPMALAPVLFGEGWPRDLPSRALLAGGILLTLAGTVALSGSSDRGLDKAQAAG